ncbi:MAG: hypothetical protein WC596_04055 [Candidatus Shapirobacteria bacterium]
MNIETFADTEVKSGVLSSNEIRKGYQEYAKSTWNSISAMNYPETGLPADHLHYQREEGKLTENAFRIDKTSPTDIGFSLGCVSAAASMGFIDQFEAHQKIDCTITTIENMMNDPEVFIKTGKNKGLFVNWIQPSTDKVLNQWPGNESPVKQQISTIDNAWLIAFSKLAGVQFPEFNSRIQNYLDQVDLPFMFNNETGFFCGCFALNPSGFESWHYDVISEARIAYLVSGENIADLMGNLINKKSERSVFTDSKGHFGRASWNGEWFAMGWPRLLVPEDKLNDQWGTTYRATIQKQKDFAIQHNEGYYGFSAGLDPNGQYYEFRNPESGESTAFYEPQTVVTISALVNMGLEEPVETYMALQQIHQKFPNLMHLNNGDGDTVNTHTGAVQRDQLFPNQAASLLTCWNIVEDCKPQNLFMQVAPSCIKDVYQRCLLW